MNHASSADLFATPDTSQSIGEFMDVLRTRYPEAVLTRSRVVLVETPAGEPGVASVMSALLTDFVGRMTHRKTLGVIVMAANGTVLYVVDESGWFVAPPKNKPEIRSVIVVRETIV